MDFYLVVLLLSVLTFHPTLSDIPEHKVTSLPGWDAPLPTTQYSGYIEIDATTGKNLHYWFVESANNPKTDPVVLWLPGPGLILKYIVVHGSTSAGSALVESDNCKFLILNRGIVMDRIPGTPPRSRMNGGPGCSSLDGYINEQGPLHFNRSDGAANATIPPLIANPHTWTKIANMIFLETPAGVGFSYSDNTSVDYTTDDNKTALDNYEFLVNWFSNYSEYSANDFYVSGESYAGIYVPTLVNTIRIMNQQNTTNYINLKGLMVGNGCVGNQVGGCGYLSGLKIHVDFYHGHGLFSDALYKQIGQACDDFKTFPSKKCTDLQNEMSKEIGGVNIYDIYKSCFNNLLPGRTVSRARNPVKELVLTKSSDYFGPDGCIDDHVEMKYFDNPEVRESIHVASVEKIGGWRLCAQQKIVYISNTASVLPLYPTLIQTYRTLIYNGDVDGCVPYIGNEQWTSGLGFRVKEGWRPWTLNHQVAGYVTEYDVNGFKFVTVKGAGHMVPQYKPEAAFAMFERFIKDERF